MNLVRVVSAARAGLGRGDADRRRWPVLLDALRHDLLHESLAGSRLAERRARGRRGRQSGRPRGEAGGVRAVRAAHGARQRRPVGRDLRQPPALAAPEQVVVVLPEDVVEVPAQALHAALDVL